MAICMLFTQSADLVEQNGEQEGEAEYDNCQVMLRRCCKSVLLSSDGENPQG